MTVGYETEDRLQALLESHPALLSAGQNAPTSRRWLLVGRELGVPDAQDATSRWSIDHLFVDQEATPTIVEVKRASDTRIRREVVGQILEYAANCAKYWPPDHLQDRFVASCAERGVSPDQELSERLGVSDSKSFWSAVRTNLEAGKLRLLFVADVIPLELQRIIEFLNEQMQHTEVLGIQVQRFSHGDVQTVVPRVIGQTAQARKTKDQQAPRPYEELIRDAPETVRQLGHNLLSWAGGMGYRIRNTASARYIETADGMSLLGFYPGFQTVEFDLRSISGAPELREDAASISSLLSRVAGKSVSAKYPQLRCEVLLAHWQETRDEILPRYVQARLNAARAQMNPAETGGTDQNDER